MSVKHLGEYIFLAITLLLFAASGIELACGTPPAAIGKSLESSTVDCTTKEVGKSIAQYSGIVSDVIKGNTDAEGHINADAIRGAATSFAVDDGMCVLADALSKAFAPSGGTKVSISSARTHSELHAVFETIRTEKAPGKTFKTAAGTL